GLVQCTISAHTLFHVPTAHIPPAGVTHRSFSSVAELDAENDVVQAVVLHRTIPLRAAHASPAPAARTTRAGDDERLTHDAGPLQCATPVYCSANQTSDGPNAEMASKPC